MAEHYVGLDIGSFAVRAAEISGEPGSWTLHRFAQLTLPPGAVVDGEIVDSLAVTEAIKNLWQRGDFKSKKVSVGIANRWVKVRQAEVPALSPDEVRTSLRYEAQEVIPFAEEDAIVDFVIQDRFTGPEGGDFLRILVVAAQRQMVSMTLDTVRKAGLTPANVDLTPFALVRALAPAGAAGASESIVSVGAGLTNVVVHTGGVPRLVRMTPRAGAAVTENLTRALGVDPERAEALKRGATVALADPQTAQAADVIANELNPLVQEIQGSLDYFTAQNDDVELRRVLLTGAGAKMAGLRARLATELRVPVEMASPLEYLKLGKTGLTDEQLASAAAVLAAPVGIAMAPLASPATRLTTLFPKEYAEAGAERRARVFTGVAVAGLAATLVGAWGVRQASVASARSDAQTATANANDLERQVQKLTPFEQAEIQINAQKTAAQAALAADVDVPVFMDTITAAMPADVGMTAFTFTIGQSAAGSLGLAPGTAPIGSISVSADGLSQDSAAHWITKLRELGILTDVWVPSSAKVGNGNNVTFSSTASITPAAKSHRADQYKAKAL
ncbi:MAG: type pilus assembly protein PilM [Actinomycetota bacterium]|jgi:type IV pilus assembly protein PilM|nr:type pilus assembly protein PilM [Actinomycetota bacterium]